MIPPDVASRLQSSADVALRPVAPAQELTDKLGGLDVGQRVLAEIQAMLPNGTYRALINQRNITLALPFSAKSGDTLELLVTESDGKVITFEFTKDALLNAATNTDFQWVINGFQGVNDGATVAGAAPGGVVSGGAR